MSMRPSRNTRTSRSIAAYASGSDRTPHTTIATAPSRLAAGRLRWTKGSRWTAMRRYVTPKMTRPVVIRTRNAEVGTRNRFALGGRSICSAFRVSRSALLDLPIREQHATPRVRLSVAFVGHPEVGPADPIAAGDEPAERIVEARLAAHRDAPDPRPRGGGLGRRDARVEGAVVARCELEHAHLVLGPALGEGRGAPQHERRQPVAAVHQRRVPESQLRGEDDLAREVVAGGECPDEVTGRRERRGARVPLALRPQRRGGMAAGGDVVRQRDREVTGREAEPRVKTDVLDRAGHGLQPQRRDSLVDEPVYRCPDDRLADARTLAVGTHRERDRKSTRLNSSHTVISYAVFCLKKKK